MRDLVLESFEIESGVTHDGDAAVRLIINDHHAFVMEPEGALEMAAKLREALDATARVLEGQAATKGRTM